MERTPIFKDSSKGFKMGLEIHACLARLERRSTLYVDVDVDIKHDRQEGMRPNELQPTRGPRRPQAIYTKGLIT